jgi:hypothetical protein
MKSSRCGMACALLEHSWISSPKHPDLRPRGNRGRRYIYWVHVLHFAQGTHPIGMCEFYSECSCPNGARSDRLPSMVCRETNVVIATN